VTWAIRRALPAPDQEASPLTPRINIPLSELRASAFRNAHRLVGSARHLTPRKVGLGAAAAAVAATGIAAGVTATASPAVTDAASVNHAVSRTAPKAAAVKTTQRKTAAAVSHRHHSGGLQTLLKTSKPYQMYDSTTPSAIPGHQIAAGYATGSYAASPSQFAGQRKVLWIDTTGSDTKAAALDVEPGDATPTTAAAWAQARLAHNPHAIARIYTMRSEWPATKAAVKALPSGMQARVRWWIADPTGIPHIVPGSAATQWYWGHSYDISTVTPRF